MKVIIQIPCYNEAATLPLTLAELPRSLPAVDVVEWLIIDDGSEDNTVEVARELGVDHLVLLPQNQGLARAFSAGLEACIQAGADIIVNLDADNQYCAADIPLLLEPIMAGRAALVIGERPIDQTAHFSPLKKILQRLGSWVVRFVSHTDVADAPSGFRAMSRTAAMQLNVFSAYSYTLETIIQAGHKGITVASVPIRTNADLRPSRLARSLPEYLRRSGLTIVRIFMTYQPFTFFCLPGAILFSLGILVGLRFLYFFATHGGQGHVQSLILGAILLGLGGFLGVTGLVADLISVNRKLLEKTNWRIQQLEERLREKE